MVGLAVGGIIVATIFYIKQRKNKFENNFIDILKDFNIIHICGKGNLDKSLEGLDGYKQFEYVKEELPHLLQAADFIISRAGANVIMPNLSPMGVRKKYSLYNNKECYVPQELIGLGSRTQEASIPSTSMRR